MSVPARPFWKRRGTAVRSASVALLGALAAAGAAHAAEDPGESAMAAWATPPAARSAPAPQPAGTPILGASIAQSANAIAQMTPVAAPAPAQSAAPSGTAMQDLLDALRRQGLIDEGEEQKVLAKYAVEQKSAVPKWLEGMKFSGDFRLRYEDQAFDEDARGVEAIDRSRFRYRARFGFSKQLGNVVNLGVRFASGTGDGRSANTSFGEGDNDFFAPDRIFFDRAFAEVKVQDSQALTTQIVVGKMGNPFFSRVGSDVLFFDNEQNVEGAYVTSSFRPSETTRFYGTLGGFVVDEVVAAKDPKLFGGQLGVETQLTSKIGLGIRASGYQYRSLNDAFVMSSMSFGNLSSAFDGRARLGETFFYANLDFSDTWPILLYGNVGKNFTADSELLAITAPAAPAAPAMMGMAPPMMAMMMPMMPMTMTVGLVDVDEEDMAYGAGFEVGSATKVLKLGLGYFRIEANAVLAQFTDSDVVDGFTNREGLVFFASRKLNTSTELRLTLYDAEEIKDRGGPMGPFARSLANADRKKAQVDVIFVF